MTQPISSRDASPTSPERTEAKPAMDPLLIPADTAACLCGRSKASWWRDHAAGRVPAPIKLGGRTLWRVAELQRWIDAGCPSRVAWDALQTAQKKGGGSR